MGLGVQIELASGAAESPNVRPGMFLYVCFVKTKDLMVLETELLADLHKTFPRQYWNGRVPSSVMGRDEDQVGEALDE